MKNIVICCDGTGNEYGERKSNVVKLYQCLHNVPGRQVTYYHPGVGTMGDMRALSEAGRAWTKFRGLAFGYGLSENIADAYRFLMQTFEEKDAIYIFGFSRGAYTARALCGMLQMVGLLSPGNEGLIPYAMRLFKKRDGWLAKFKGSPNKFRIAAGFKSTFGRDCKPHFLGIWDTVSSVGWILDPIGVKPGSLPYTYELAEVSVIRHAVSLDERRAFFRSNLTCHDFGRSIKQVWFAGVHSDVGGSYDEAESGLANITLKWMLQEAGENKLMLNDAKVRLMLESIYHARPLANAPIHNSLTPSWWLGEFWPKVTRRKVSAPGALKERWLGWPRLNLFRRRFVPENSCIHASVLHRQQLLPAYKPSNLPQQMTIEPDHQTVPSQLQLAPGQSATFGIFACLMWNNTTLEVHSGETYEIYATGTWNDAQIRSGPDGYQSPSLLMRIFAPLRRRPKDNWFALIGAVGEQEKGTFLIGKNLRWQPAADGALYCYANDVPGFYFNNSGTIKLSATRIT